MNDPAAPELDATRLAGKARRVAGTFVLMIGAGMIIDVHALWAGVPIMAAGVGLFAWGFVTPRTRERVQAPLGTTTESHP